MEAGSDSGPVQQRNLQQQQQQQRKLGPHSAKPFILRGGFRSYDAVEQNCLLLSWKNGIWKDGVNQHRGMCDTRNARFICRLGRVAAQSAMQQAFRNWVRHHRLQNVIFAGVSEPQKANFDYLTTLPILILHLVHIWFTTHFTNPWDLFCFVVCVFFSKRC